jgi:hypothetical protein
MSTENLQRSERMQAESIDTLLSQYIDLVNQYGLKAKPVQDFEKKYAENQELVKLMESTRDLQRVFAEGYLKPDDPKPSNKK